MGFRAPSRLDCTSLQVCDETKTTPVCAPKKADGADCTLAKECSTEACTTSKCGVPVPPATDAGTSGGTSGSTSGAVGNPPNAAATLQRDSTDDSGCTMAPPRRSSENGGSAVGLLAVGLAAVARRCKNG